MSGWQVGDMALCVSVQHRDFAWPSLFLRKGAFYTVEKVGTNILPTGENVLGLVGVKPSLGHEYGFPSSLFIKVTPSREIIEEERQVEVRA